MKRFFKNKKGLLLLAVFLAVVSSPKEVKAKKKPTPTPTVVESRRLAAMRKAVQVYAYEKGTDVVSDVTGIFDQKSQKVNLKCEFKNLSKKDIHGVRGILRFTTIFGDFITDQSLESTAVIAPGQVISISWDIPSERFTGNSMETFKKLKLDQMKQIWYPRMIVFTDGTTLKE